MYSKNCEPASPHRLSLFYLSRLATVTKEKMQRTWTQMVFSQSSLRARWYLLAQKRFSWGFFERLPLINFLKSNFQNWSLSYICAVENNWDYFDPHSTLLTTPHIHNNFLKINEHPNYLIPFQFIWYPTSRFDKIISQNSSFYNKWVEKWSSRLYLKFIKYLHLK